jgi:hypothetical protein
VCTRYLRNGTKAIADNVGHIGNWPKVLAGGHFIDKNAIEQFRLGPLLDESA